MEGSEFIKMEILKVLVETSSRHVHVTKEDLEKLFGPGAVLHHKRDLSQPGQFLTEEKVRLEGPKRAIDGVSILGPERPATQVEISLTDARSLGIAAPVRESGNVSGSAPLKIVGPAGEVEITEGAIAAKRHIHLTPEDSAKYGLNDKEIVCVTIEGDRALTFGEVVVRVSDKFATAMHVDTDESNAAGLSGTVYGVVIKK